MQRQRSTTRSIAATRCCASSRRTSNRRRVQAARQAPPENTSMRFGLFGSAQARRPQPATELTDSSQGFRDWIENNVEAEALGFHSTFVVEHHFTGFGQVSASLNLLTWLGARTSTLPLGTAVLVLPWHNPALLPDQPPPPAPLSSRRLSSSPAQGHRYKQLAGFCIP